MGLWFTEELDIVPGWRQQIGIKETLHSEKSDFQKIELFETEAYGRMLVLDNVVMCTEFDEFCYHEMISHVPLFAHPNPKSVLVVGGGDGGTVREVLKHPDVAEVHLCELDRRVVELSQEYLPSMAGRLDNPRVQIYYEDGIKWVADRKDSYDVIITDSTDPVGPAEALFQYDFYRFCRDSLREGGILVNQAENFLLHQDIIRRLIGYGKELFPVHRYYHTHVPTYPGGMIGFTFFSKGTDPFANLETRSLARSEYAAIQQQLRYWSPEMHRASFALPPSVEASLFGD